LRPFLSSSRWSPNDGLPEGYEQIRLPGTTVVAHRAQLDAIRTALAAGTLYEYAARRPESRPLAGRGIAYAVALPGGERVVVRHNRHGGLFARVTGDRFLSPTRAPYELAASIRLTNCGVFTPTIVAYAIYDAGPLLRRTDVVSLEIPNATDLAAILVHGTDVERREAIRKTAFLIGSLSECGARHHDLNIKNVLLMRNVVEPSSMSAYVLDVDRVTFGQPGSDEITEANIARLQRSARKWRALHRARIDERELEWLAVTSRRAASSPTVSPSSTRS
jgi:Lipopolysaccharide kinase (Kdo/WaaP) family